MVGTDSGGLSAQTSFDLSITGHTGTASVVSRAGLALPGVTAYEIISTTPGGSLYGFKNIAVDTHPVTGMKTMSADVVATGSSAEGALDLTFQAHGGATLQSFQFTGSVSAANGWTLLENTQVANTYGVTAIKVDGSIAADSILGKITITLPSVATGGSILSLTDATLGSQVNLDREITYGRIDLGNSGQTSATLPDSNLAISFDRGTADYLVAGKRPITAADALDALKLSVGLNASQGNSWKELIAADMNHDGRVTAADALEILKTSVGINTIQPSWVFVPNDASGLASMTRTTASYKDEFNLSSITAPTSATITGILVGDVNNSWVIPT